jgi:uncharacterized protein YndB with AHSA1/START domain
MRTEAKEGSMNILGTLRADDGEGVVRMDDRLETRIDDAWSALTDPARLARWLGEIEGDLRIGGEFRAHFLASGWKGTGRIEVCDPPQRLLVKTRDEDASDGDFDHVLEVRLTADGDSTLVVWEERGMPENLLAAYGAGIQVHVEDLASHLAGGERCEAAARFEELFAAYRDLEASAYIRPRPTR